DDDARFAPDLSGTLRTHRPASELDQIRVREQSREPLDGHVREGPNRERELAARERQRSLGVSRGEVVADDFHGERHVATALTGVEQPQRFDALEFRDGALERVDDDCGLWPSATLHPPPDQETDGDDRGDDECNEPPREWIELDDVAWRFWFSLRRVGGKDAL